MVSGNWLTNHVKHEVPDQKAQGNGTAKYQSSCWEVRHKKKKKKYEQRVVATEVVKVVLWFFFFGLCLSGCGLTVFLLAVWEVRQRGFYDDCTFMIWWPCMSAEQTVNYVTFFEIVLVSVLCGW